MINPTRNSFCALHATNAVKYTNVKPSHSLNMQAAVCSNMVVSCPIT